MNPQDYMKIALKEAEKAFKADEVPVGALIVDPISGEIVARAHNVGVGNVCDAGTLHDVRGGRFADAGCQNLFRRRRC